MKKKLGTRVLSLLLTALLLVGLLPVAAFAAETAGKFVLVVEAGGELVVAPEYVAYEEGQTIMAALAASGHEFTGLDAGAVTAVDGVTGNFTRSDQNGSYDLSISASEVTHYRFSEDTGTSQPSEGLQALMTAMADYLLEEADVQAAAKSAYDTAYAQFVGISSDSAKTLTKNLKDAVSSYKSALEGEQYPVTFTDGASTYSGASITAENAYGKIWTDDGDGVLELPAGSYTFCISQNGLQAEGGITVSSAMTVKAALPETQWLKTFRLSLSYDGTETQFADDELTAEGWEDRNVTVPVVDTFTGTIYTYAEYNSAVLTSVPTLTAIYKTADERKETQQQIPLSSYASGAANILKKGAVGNTVAYRVSSTGSDGYTYSQDYTVEYRRIPTLTGIAVSDQEGTDQAATEKFAANKTEYTYKVLDEVTSVTVKPAALSSGYTVTVNGQDAAEGVTVAVNGETAVAVKVSYGTYENTYTLTILPGEGQKITFVTASADVSVEVTNGNGMTMPCKKYQGSDTYNRYQYTLVAGDAYNYIATKGTYYHVTDDFTLDDLTNNIITVDVSTKDWLSDLALADKTQAKQKGTLKMDSEFDPEDHSYQAEKKDTEHLLYVWVDTDEDVTIQALYDQIFASALYHGKPYTIDLTAGKSTGEQIKRLLLYNHPLGNTVTIRLTKEENGVTCYQDYVLDISRKLSLSSITAQCDGSTATLTTESGSTGYSIDVTEYTITVPMAAKTLTVSAAAYTSTCYGEETNSYRVFVDDVDVTEDGSAEIELDGTINTQTVVVSVRSDDSPNGTTDYVLNILKSPPVETTFALSPSDAQLTIHEDLSGDRLWPAENGTYQLCEGFSYSYALTRYGYVAKSGTLTVTRDSANALVIMDGTASYTVEEKENGGVVTIEWTLTKAAANGALNSSLNAQWPNFRGNSANNGVTSAKIPYAAEDGTLYWANKIGEGIDSGAVGSPIIVDGDLITYARNTIFRVDTVTGEVLKTGTMDHKSSFAITPPTYANGMVFVALSNGTVQAFDASTLESLWLYTDPLGGQPNCPLTVKNGYLYTGFWNSETGDANFVCLSITDEDPSQTKESKCASWYYTVKGGFYWAGAYASDDFVIVGTDDGTNGYTSNTSRLLLLEPKTGELLDSWDNLCGDIRSTVVYDSTTDAYYVTSKGGKFYSVQVSQTDDGWKFTNQWSLTLGNGSGSTAMSTCSPAIYNGRAYVGVCGTGQFNNYSGHNISVIDLSGKKIAYRVATQGYPQTSGLVTTAYGGYVYVYFFDNATPGKLRVLRDKAGQTSADYVTTEGSYTAAYALFTPTGDQAQYAICSPIVDEYGTIYFKNDSAYLMAFGSMIEKLEVTTMPEKTTYAVGETFDPTGMVVTATYANGMTKDVTAYVTYNEEALAASDSEFTISFEYVMYHNQEDGTSMISGVETTTPTVTLKLTVGDDLLGDVNGDATVDLTDTQMILDYKAQNLEDELSLITADVSGDGVIDSNDAVLIAQYLDGKVTNFPADTTEESEQETQAEAES